LIDRHGQQLMMLVEGNEDSIDPQENLFRDLCDLITMRTANWFFPVQANISPDAGERSDFMSS
jgi:hypothetical protein